MKEFDGLFQTKLGVALNSQAAILNELGNSKEALVKIEEAIKIFRALAPDNPTLMHRKPTTDLKNKIYEMLSQFHPEDAPETLRPQLAESLNTKAIVLTRQGLIEEALLASKEAVDIHRVLAKENLDAFATDLIISLKTMGKILLNLGRHEDSLKVTEELAGVYQNLNSLYPSVYSSELNKILAVLENEKRNK